ncbi:MULTISPECIES: hypothetical protein [unclassified Lactococcus]|uniref:hypothetical protein n=1 Tax=unclassified Lactococcus TaxID=2643510 RepID=UPI0011C7F0D7|nr:MULTISPECIES: hypothetical protein [unclassified Lactococcus]MQW24099.1 hypothetical protein [Lactococcus sp. dk101]TXK33918.1 hypothetical protein FVP42_11405 [Lactococcus sp. dk310]TXK45698.1 hypothetical protein FVP43_11470 [Lactococcus sp. dk322]
MTDRTRKEFADYLKMDVKKLADKIRYQEQKHGINFGIISEDTKIYTEQEQYDICKLLEIPVFHVSVQNNTENFLSELNREKIENSFNQLSELISQVNSTDFVKLDRNFQTNVLRILGEDFEDWYQENKRLSYGLPAKSARIEEVAIYLAERE